VYLVKFDTAIFALYFLLLILIRGNN